MTSDGTAQDPTRDRPIRWRRALLLAAGLPLGLALQAACAAVPDMTEAVYARGIYPWIEAVLGFVARWTPIALGETLLIGGIALVVVRIVRGLRSRRRRERSLRNLGGHAVAQLLATAGVLFLTFQLLWGLNHARLPFATQVGLEPGPVAPSVLAEVVVKLADRAAARRPADLEPLDGAVATDWRDRVADAYDAVAADVPTLAGPRPAIHGAWISPLMTWSSVTGIYSPFTGEPNVNVHMPQVLWPFVACHEVAHLRGFAREDEANFIAWWVGSRSGDPVLAYSCELNAFRIALGQLWAANFKAYVDIADRIPPVVDADAEAIARFWRGQPAAVQKVLTTVATTTNDIYLKSSGHREGVESYGRMVDLLVAALAD